MEQYSNLNVHGKITQKAEQGTNSDDVVKVGGMTPLTSKPTSSTGATNAYYKGQIAVVDGATYICTGVSNNAGDDPPTSSTVWTYTWTPMSSPDNVTGPQSATDGHVAVFDGATGKAIKDSGFTIGKSVPSNAVFTDDHVTAVGNHYTPSGGTETSASGGSNTNITGSTNATNVVTGVIKDAAGHITGVASKALYSTDQSVTAVGNHYTPSGGTETSASSGADTNITNLGSGNGINVVTGVVKDAAGHITGVTSKALRSVDTITTATDSGTGNLVTGVTANNGALTITKGVKYSTDVDGTSSSGTYIVQRQNNGQITVPPTPATDTDAASKAFVNSSVGTNTATFRGTYNAVSDLNNAQAQVDMWEDPPSYMGITDYSGFTSVDQYVGYYVNTNTDSHVLVTSANKSTLGINPGTTKAYNNTTVESTVAGQIATKLSSLSVTPENNDYVFISVDQTPVGDLGEDWYWRFKYSDPNNDHTGSWGYEYTLNNSSFTQAQWDAVNSGITADKVSKLDGIEAGAEVNVNADWNASSGDAQILNRPTFSTGLSVSNANVVTIASTSVSSGSYGPTQASATTLAYGGTFKVPKYTVGADGRLTASEDIQFTLPASDNTDYKACSYASTSTKLFLVGAASQSSSATTGVATNSNANCYVGTDNHLYSNAKQVVNLSDTQSLSNKTYNGVGLSGNANGDILLTGLGTTQLRIPEDSGYTLAGACAKAVDTSIAAASTSANLPTSQAVASFVEGKGYLTSHQTIKQDGITGATANRYAVCSTAASTAAKTASVTSGTFSLETGARVTVKFNNANTATTSPTLNINSTGAKNILHKGATFVDDPNDAGGISLLSGVCDFVYDGSAWNLIGDDDGKVRIHEGTISSTRNILLAPTFGGNGDYNGGVCSDFSLQFDGAYLSVLNLNSYSQDHLYDTTKISPQSIMIVSANLSEDPLVIDRYNGITSPNGFTGNLTGTASNVPWSGINDNPITATDVTLADM